MKYLILAEAKIPENVREALIILAPLPKPEGDLIFQAKVQDLASFKGGDRLFINLSDTNIGVKIGDTAVAVPAKQANIYSSPKLGEPANMPIIYNYYHPEQNKWKLLTASTVVIMPKWLTATLPRRTVKVKKGWVTLRGEVDWDYQRHNAEAAVRPLTGVKGVANKIHLRAREAPDCVAHRIHETLSAPGASTVDQPPTGAMELDGLGTRS